ncbi:hypothetical protein, partial [Acinetobacter sp. YH12036]|uniref:hypothetical protein n=1 Tax=Acinetobacter sp. YH12036 TaxID=2601046 RepID=UPI001C5509FC
LIFATLKKLLTMLKRGHGVQGFPLSQRPLLNEMIKVGKCPFVSLRENFASLRLILLALFFDSMMMFGY